MFFCSKFLKILFELSIKTITGGTKYDMLKYKESSYKTKAADDSLSIPTNAYNIVKMIPCQLTHVVDMFIVY